jgi:hypothetical protein
MSLPFLLCGLAQAADHYVDQNASGANDGSSWINAWESIIAISWGSVAPGDTVYISGGSSSKTSNETLDVAASGSAGNPITITGGADPGHDGTVILDGQMSLTYGVLIENTDYVTVRGLDVRNYTGNGMLSLYPFGQTAILVAYNNTLVGGYWGTIRLGNAPGSVVKNNVLMLTRTGSTMGIEGSPSGYDIDYNLYWNPDSSYLATQDSSGKSWSEWRGLGYEAHGINANPLLSDVSQLDFRLSAGSPAIDVGVALGAPYDADMDRVPRPQGSGWEMGTHETGWIFSDGFESGNTAGWASSKP